MILTLTGDDGREILRVRVDDVSVEGLHDFSDIPDLVIPEPLKNASACASSGCTLHSPAMFDADVSQYQKVMGVVPIRKNVSDPGGTYAWNPDLPTRSPIVACGSKCSEIGTHLHYADGTVASQTE